MSIGRFTLELDVTGTLPANAISAESHTLYDAPIRLVTPDWGAFFTGSMQITSAGTPLVKGVDWVATELLHKVTFQVGNEVHLGILILNQALSGTVELAYQALGGKEQANHKQMLQEIADLSVTATIPWTSINHPKEFQPSAHKQDSADMYGAEYIVDAINRVKKAVQATDNAVHSQIINQAFPIACERFYDVYNTVENDRIDVIQSLVDSANQAIVSANEVRIDTDHDRIRTDDLLSKLRLENARSLNNSYNDVYAIALGELCRQQMRQTGTVMPVPAYIRKLDCWFDFTDPAFAIYSPGSFYIKDKSKNARVFVSNTARKISNASLMCDVGLLEGGAIFTKSSGPDIHLTSPSTIFILTAKNSTYTEDGTIFKGPMYQLDIRVADNKALDLCNIATGKTVAAVGCDHEDTFTSHLTVMALSNTDREDYSCTNSLETNYRNYNGLKDKPSVTGLNLSFNQIGSGNMNDHVQIAEILIFKEQLSRYETDAVLEYFKQSYGIEVNMVANGNFTSGLAEFETDYDLSIEAGTPGTIAAIERIAVGALTGPFAAFYIYPNYNVIMKQMPEYNKFLAINTHPDPTKAIWRQKIKVVKGVKHELRLTVLYNPLNPPTFEVRINGQLHPKVVALTTTNARLDNVAYAFSAPDDEIVIELFNINTTGPINTFAIDNIHLCRKFRAISN